MRHTPATPTTVTAPCAPRLLAAACLALCAATAQAATPTQAELDSIVLYGSTTIAQDSTNAWGIWEQLEPTAAGPNLPRIDNFAQADLYRPLAQFTLGAAPAATADMICSGGSICGFGVFYDAYSYGGSCFRPPPSALTRSQPNLWNRSHLPKTRMPSRAPRWHCLSLR